MRRLLKIMNYAAQLMALIDIGKTIKRWRFFRSMNRKIPHALDEHEGNTLGFAEVLIPGARQQVVDQGGDVADVDAAVLVAVGTAQADTRSIAAKQIVDQGCHVADVHVVVAVHVTTQASVLGGEVARVAGAAVDVGVGLVHMVGIIGRALTAHQVGTVLEHICGTGNGIRTPTTSGIDGCQVAATIEHVFHISHLGRVKTTQVKARQACAKVEHAIHTSHLGRVEVAYI